MICEHCKNRHNENYGSGRFCSSICARSFSTSKNRKIINKKISNKLKGHRCIKGGLLKLCDYGCGKEAQHQLKNGKWCCSNSPNKCLIIKKKNSTSIKKVHNENRGRIFTNKDIIKSHKKRRKNLKELYDNLSFIDVPFSEKCRIILNDQNNKCLLCGINKWNFLPLKLQLDHIDGNNYNEVRENLRYICPNCHSQTETYCGKNINNKNETISDNDFLNILKKSKNIRQALLSCNLTPKGRNYNRAYKLLINDQLNNEKDLK